MLTANEIKKKAKPVIKRHGIPYAALFGSYARGEGKKASDVDILFASRRGMTLLDLVSLKHDLEGALKKKVDLVSREAVDERLKPYIFGSPMISIYEKRRRRVSRTHS